MPWQATDVFFDWMARDEEIQRKKVGKKNFYQFFVVFFGIIVISVFFAVAFLRVLKGFGTKERWGNQSPGAQE